MEFRALPVELLGWYDRAARALPWRVGPAERAAGVRPDPYRVWLSEIMLQQTTIAHATRYWLEFTGRWPSVEALAAADDAEVMAAWAGLGYYARARNLLKCARVVAELGGFPTSRAGLQALPGIGPYTSGAIAAIAFGARAPAVDGNVERVMARLMAARGPWPDEKRRIRSVVEALVPADRPGEFAEAMMDLGATVCTHRSPNCPACPVSAMCAARAEGMPERYPVKPKKAAKPKRRGEVFLFERAGAVCLVRRPPEGLLGGMLALPTTGWGQAPAGRAALLARFAARRADLRRIGEVRHVFTHFELTLEVWHGPARGGAAACEWRRPREVAGLPSVFEKAFRLAYPSRPISER